jgi:hypothetical protein
MIVCGPVAECRENIPPPGILTIEITLWLLHTICALIGNLGNTARARLDEASYGALFEDARSRFVISGCAYTES